MEVLSALLVLVIALTAYLLPTIIAFVRGHASKWGIFITNLLLGWSLIFWIVALIWSLSNKGQSQTTIVNVGSGNSYNVSQTSQSDK
ncbi:immunity to superinfection [Shigella virus Moo19]|uniref:Membrane immunity protein n=1 Tax=Shigella virus Moo19 TaxID=2886042 RepID=A0AAE8YCQ2_9CAUD|nr:immunity to superinfection [Shigella virus Moo19]UEN68837.1 putative membrane immunity protein [Shigella virus Moo19]